MFHGVRRVMFHGVRRVMFHGVRRAMFHGVRRVMFHGVRRAMFHGVRRAMFHGVRRAMFHGVRRAMFHGVRRAMFHGVRRVSPQHSHRGKTLKTAKVYRSKILLNRKAIQLLLNYRQENLLGKIRRCQQPKTAKNLKLILKDILMFALFKICPSHYLFIT
jgi:hypothetical protein